MMISSYWKPLCIGFLLTYLFHIETTFGQQNFQFDHLSVKDGLLDDITYEVFQDSKGYVWIGTAAGLQRYDGYSFLNLKFDPANPDRGLRENIIRCITELDDGSIWAGTQGGGIVRYKNGELQSPLYHQPNNRNSLSGEIVEEILQTKDGAIWIATKKGLDRYDGQNFTHFKHDPNDAQSISDNEIFSLLEDSQGRLWVGTHFGLNLYQGNGKFQRILHDPGDPKSIGGNFIHDMYQDLKGNIWLGIVEGGLNRFDPLTNTSKRYQNSPSNKNSLSSNAVLSISEDLSGNLWIATWGGGLNKFDGKDFARFLHDPSDPASISSDNVEHVMRDLNGNIWTANHLGGVNRYSERKITVFSESALSSKGMIPMKGAQEIMVAHDSSIWVLTNEGVNRYKNGLFRSFPYLEDNRLNTMFEDSRNNLWFGTIEKGLKRLSRGNFTSFKHDRDSEDGLHDNSITSIAEDTNGNIWFGGLSNGLGKYSYSTQKFTTFHSTQGRSNTLADNKVTDIAVAQDGAIWIATGRGLSKYYNNQFTSFFHAPNEPTSLPKNNLTTVCVDGDGNIWVGFSGGLAKMESANGKFSTYTEKDGLAGTIVEEIFLDANDNIWAVTHDGASVLNRSVNQFTSFTEKDGFSDPRLAFGFGSKVTNEVFFVSWTGFYSMSISDLTKKQETYKVAFTEFKLNAEITDEQHNVIQKSFENGEKIKLSHLQNSLSLKFAAFSGEINASHSYYYRVKNLQEEWSFLGNRNQIDFTYLEPDTYEVEVKTRNCQSGSCMAKLTLEISPPWWMTSWFRVTAAILIISLVFLIYQWRVRSLQQQRSQLTTEVTDRTQEVKKAVELLKENIEQLLKSGESLKKRSGSLANEAQNQAKAAGEIEIAIENILSHSRNNTENVKNTNEISKKIVEKLHDIRKATESHTKEIKSISGKTAVLDEIFSQTSILALNASVEAARAGDAGKGFSVIAHEIRSLAEKSEIASKEINQSASKGVKETEQVGQLISNFVPEVEKSAEVFAEITHSSISQSESVGQVNDFLKVFLKNSQNNSQISQDIYNISIQLGKLANYLNEQAEEIRI